MTNIDLENIDILLDKFFAGDTSVGEEKALEAFFCSGAKLPPEYECYRDMFGWYASGMDYAKLPKEDTPTMARPKSWRRKAIVWWSSSAAAVAIAAALALGWAYSPSPNPRTSLYAETLVERNGRIIEGETEIGAEINAAIIAGFCLEQEIDAQMNLIDIE